MFIHFQSYLGQHLFPHTLPWCNTAYLFPWGSAPVDFVSFFSLKWDIIGRLEGNSSPTPLSQAGIKFQCCASVKAFLPENCLCYGEGFGHGSQGYSSSPPARTTGDLIGSSLCKYIGITGVKVYKNVEDYLRPWPTGVCHCHASTHSASSNSPELTFKCSY